MASSHCVFCANHCSGDKGLPPFLGGCGSAIGSRLKVIFILRNVLGLSEDKANQLLGGKVKGKLEVCEPCEEVVASCLEAVCEIAKLENKLARMSVGLKEHVFNSRDKAGEGVDSLWGQTRLEVLFPGVFDTGTAFNQDEQLDSSSLVDDNLSIAESHLSEASGGLQDPACDDASMQNMDSQGGDPYSEMDGDDDFDSVAGQYGSEGGSLNHDDDGDSIFGDPSIEMEQKEFTPAHTTNGENEEESCSSTSVLQRRSTCNRVSTRLLGRNAQRMEFETSSSSGDNRRKKPFANQMRRQPDGLYHCPFCPKKFVSAGSRHHHKEVHFPKHVCKVCNRSYSYSSAFVRHLRSKLCGEKSYNQWKSIGGSGSWKQFLK